MEVLFLYLEVQLVVRSGLWVEFSLGHHARGATDSSHLRQPYISFAIFKANWKFLFPEEILPSWRTGGHPKDSFWVVVTWWTAGGRQDQSLKGAQHGYSTMTTTKQKKTNEILSRRPALSPSHSPCCMRPLPPLQHFLIRESAGVSVCHPCRSASCPQKYWPIPPPLSPWPLNSEVRNPVCGLHGHMTTLPLSHAHFWR